MILAKFIKETQLTVQQFNTSDLRLCRMCALRFSRQLLEDLCELVGNRHG
jgi:hypothetical protein